MCPRIILVDYGYYEAEQIEEEALRSTASTTNAKGPRVHGILEDANPPLSVTITGPVHPVIQRAYNILRGLTLFPLSLSLSLALSSFSLYMHTRIVKNVNDTNYKPPTVEY